MSLCCSTAAGQYNAEVDAYTRFVVGKIKEYGADAIVGLHPHIIQRSEYADGIFTAFCLGNFLSTRIDDSGEIDWRYNAVLNMRLSKRADGSIGQKYSFALCYTDSSLGYPVIRNTAEMYAENPTADLKEKILVLRLALRRRRKLRRSEIRIRHPVREVNRRFYNVVSIIKTPLNKTTCPRRTAVGYVNARISFPSR